MSIVLYHHPWSRAATTVWMLEEVGQPYELRFVDLNAGAQRSADHERRNRMHKVPVLDDGDVRVSENAAIAMYLADRYAPGRLAPALDAAQRGSYLRWCVFAPSVIEPACMAKASGWAYSPRQAGFGTYDDMLATLEEAVGSGTWLLGETFTMADVVVGATARWMLRFGMMKSDVVAAYADRLAARPALQRADAVNARVTAEHGLTPPGA
ncbi:MAG: glutathione S-transferase family protein [Myxococcales bacterium]|nr:glutathione S-transferase family protein [Myxococcales bacterium]MCB9531455.1 glutathione S-transferase family protein [Myxococcales bacterium]MCB9534034.1 glutathione S-transferase family protein [Myxococcales bacterium]